MSNVGILAAMTISTLGPSSDVVCFFNSIVSLLENGERGSKFFYITERLYRRSLNHDELHEVEDSLKKVNELFRGVPTNSVNLFSFGLDRDNTRLILSGYSLSDVFYNFFKVLFEALECTKVFYDEFKEYIPVRLGFVDSPFYMIDINRPSVEYDALSLSDTPFWLR